MARVTVLYFASLRDALGIAEERVELPDGIACGDALLALSSRHPAARELFATCRLAVDQAFASGALALREGSEVAVIPPVSGG